MAVFRSFLDVFRVRFFLLGVFTVDVFPRLRFVFSVAVSSVDLFIVDVIS